MHSKKLVLFSDGTGNSAGKLFKTNVWRMYQALDLTDREILQFPRQFAYYDDGVGTSTFKPLAILGGAFGVGLARNVLDLYIFLCRTYQPGDKIYAFGFSRGAFTIRVLVELVMKQGLLRYGGSEADLQRWAREAYRAYRRETFPGTVLVKAMRWLRDHVLGIRDRCLHLVPYEQAERIAKPGEPDEIHIEFLGLWDTVDAYGLPFDPLTRAIDRYIMPLSIPTYHLNPRVAWARHALSLDDERKSFYPRLWTEEGQDSITAEHVNKQRICQVWFAGVHSNVGGGYPDDSLSYVPLLWMMREAHEHGLRFKAAIWRELRALSDENGPMYDSRKGLAGYYTYAPRRMECINDDRQGHVKVARGKVHESVLRRIRVDPDGYAPSVLAGDFDVVRIDGQIMSVNAYIDDMVRKEGLLPRAEPTWFEGYMQGREQVWNTIWCRRVAYNLTLVVSLTLLSMPIWAPGAGTCHSELCFLTAPIKWVDYFLPSFATVWTDAFNSSPGAFVVLLGFLIVSFKLSRYLDIQISDRMRSVWYAIAPLKPKAIYGARERPVPTETSRIIESVRNHTELNNAIKLMTHHVLPLLFVLAMVGYLTVLGTQLLFAARESFGSLCGPSATGNGWFSPAEKCYDTHTQVVAGQTYQVAFYIPDEYAWSDASIPADPSGYSCNLPWYKELGFAAFAPARRHPTLGWFQPVVKIGATGNDVYALEGARVEPSQLLGCPTARLVPPCPAEGSQAVGQATVGKRFTLHFVAHSKGALYLYVNDVVGVPLVGNYFYDNNHGCAHISVSAIP